MIHVYNFFLKSRAFKRTVASQKESNQHASAPDPSLKEIMMIMKKMVPLLISLFLLVSFSPVLAKTKTFIKQYTDQVSEDDNRDSSQTIALWEVKRLLLEEVRRRSDEFLRKYEKLPRENSDCVFALFCFIFRNFFSFF